MSNTIIEYGDINEVFTAISKDMDTKDYLSNRYPVRFIFVPNFDELGKLYAHLNESMELEELDTSKLLLHDDGKVTPQSIVETIKSKSSNILVTSLSEIVRFYNTEDFISLFSNLAYIEQKNRIYVPLVGLYSRFNNEFMPKFTRSNEWAPIWRLNILEIEPIKIFIPQFKYEFKSSEEYMLINNISEWLSHWGQLTISEKPIICTSKNIAFSCGNVFPDHFFKFNTLKDQSEFLKYFLGIDIPIDFKKEDEKYWNRLIEMILANPKFNTLEKIILELTNKRKIDDNEIFDMWLNESFDDLLRWLLKHYTVLNGSDTYIKRILELTHEYTIRGIENLLWEKILEISVESQVFKKMSEERKNYLNKFYKKYSENEIDPKVFKGIDEIIHQKSKLTHKLDYLTNSTYFEKFKIFEILAEYSDRNRDELLNSIRSCYPELYFYLSQDTGLEKENWINEYFTEYRWARVLDNPENIKTLINEHNMDSNSFYGWYYTLKNIHAEYNVKKCNKTVWIDALGLEWVPLIKSIVNSYSNISIEIDEVSSNLPTTTESNKFENVPKIGELDAYIHKQIIYNHPKNLIEELDLVGELFNKICNNLKEDTLIVSDHGFTAFATKKYSDIAMGNIDDTEHSGRCGWVNENITTNEIVTHKLDNRYAAICLKHNSFNKTPRKEVHGGATPEEVIIPLIHLRLGNKNENKHIDYHIEVIKKSIAMRDKILLNVTPKPNTVKLKDSCDNEYTMDYFEGVWSLHNPSKKAGLTKYEILLNNGPVKNIEINTIGFIEKNLGI